MRSCRTSFAWSTRMYRPSNDLDWFRSWFWTIPGQKFCLPRWERGATVRAGNPFDASASRTSHRKFPGARLGPPSWAFFDMFSRAAFLIYVRLFAALEKAR
jgi:hypothetical protein